MATHRSRADRHGHPLQGGQALSEFRYLTFDCYGTLIDWKKGIESSLTGTVGPLPIRGRELLDAYVAAERKQEGAYKSYREVLARTAGELAMGFGMKAAEKAYAAFAGSVPDWPAFPDSARALEDLGKKGYRRYILSNVDTDILRATISRNRFAVDGYVTAQETGSYKPDFGHWLEFIERTGARKGEILHVAQSVYHDIIPTGKLGIQSAWVNRYGEGLDRKAQPFYIADSLENLAKALE